MNDPEVLFQGIAILFGAGAAILALAAAWVRFPKSTGAEDWGSVAEPVGPSSEEIKIMAAQQRARYLGIAAAALAGISICLQATALFFHLR